MRFYVGDIIGAREHKRLGIYKEDEKARFRVTKDCAEDDLTIFCDLIVSRTGARVITEEHRELVGEWCRNAYLVTPVSGRPATVMQDTREYLEAITEIDNVR